MIKPNFLSHINIMSDDETWLNKVLSNWEVLSKALYNNELDTPNVEKAIVIELNGKKRIHILDRLMSKRSRQLKNSEVKEILDIINQQGDK